MATRELRVNIVGDSKDLERALGRATNSSKSFGSTMARMGKYALIAGGAAGLGALAVSLKRGFDEMSEGQRVAAQTAAALKSTGGIANVTAKQVEALAQAQSNLTGIDDEAVQAGENMLLTFTKIRNEVGKGNDIFDQATVAIEDMATRMADGAIPSGEQLSKTAIRVGKALNDPIKGVGALARVGVMFTEQQKKQIAAMVKSGDVMGAQKLILRELNTEFGGSAKAAGETFPGQLAKLRNAFDNAAQGLVVALLPSLTSLLEFINRNMPAIQAVMQRTGQVIATAFQIAGPLIVGIVEALASVVGWFQKGGAAADILLAALAGLTAGIVAYIVVTKTVAVATQAWAIATGILNAVMAANPIVLVAAALVALGAALVVAYMKSETFRRIVQGALEAVRQAAAVLVAFFTGTVAPALSRVWDIASAAVQKYWSYIGPVIRAVIEVVRGMVNIVAGLLTGDWSRAWNGLKQAVSGAVDAVKGYLRALGTAISNAASDAYSAALALGGSIASGLIDGIKGIGEALWNSLPWYIRWAIKKTAADIPGGSPLVHFAAVTLGEPITKGTIEGVGHLGTELSPKLKEQLKKALTDAQQAVRDARTNFVSAFSTLASEALGAFDAAMGQWKPKAQILLDRRQLNRQKQELKDAITSAAAELKTASAELTTALMGGDPEQIATAQAQRLAAQKAYNDALAAQTDFNLQQQAAKQQEAHDKQAARDRIAFANRLAALQNDYLNQEITTKEFHKRLNALMEKYGVDQQFYGTAAGIAFANGITKATNAVVAAFTRLLKRLERLGKLKSNAEEGPLSDIETWWVGMAPALIKGIDFGLIRAAGVRIGAEMGSGLKETKVDTSGILASLGILKGTTTPAVESLTEVSDSYDTVSESIGIVTQKAAALWQPLIDGAKKAFVDLNDPLTGIASLYLLVADAISAIGAAAYATRDALSDTAAEIVKLWRQIAASGAPIPGKALGGPVYAGRPYVVGESGPELFIPSTSGRIVANGNTSMRAAGGQTVIALNFYGPTVGTSREFQDVVRRALYDVSRRNPGTGLALA